LQPAYKQKWISSRNLKKHCSLLRKATQKDAVILLKKGKFSASAYITIFITKKINVEVVHASGKANE
jgi:hypothetical protein